MDVEYSRPGEILIGGIPVDHDVIVEGGRPSSRKKDSSNPYRARFGHSPLSTDVEIPWPAPKLVIGIGTDGRLPVVQEVRDFATRAVELVELPTSEACQLLRSVRPAEVSIILHATC